MIRLGHNGGFFTKPGAKVLALLLHAYMLTPKSLEPVAAAVREAYPDSDIYAPSLPVSMLSCADPERIAADLVTKIDQLDRSRRQQPDSASYQTIILVGHSLGAVMARKVWALAHSTTRSGEVDPTLARPWAAKIKRIVLLAATNRGWMVSSAFDPFTRLMWTLGSGWGNVCRFILRREPLIFGFRRGAPFLTTTRLQCLAVSAALRARGAEQPITVQLIGTADDYVAPTDNIDLATGQAFYYLEVTDTTHREIVRLEESASGTSAAAGFRIALTADVEILKKQSVAQEDVFDLFDESVDNYDISNLPVENRKVQHVVFVIHGIRDRGFWTRRIARRIKERARARGEYCRSVTSTYGYFPMGPFLLPWVRRAKVEWLLDQYVAAKALYPAAEFAYVGHSNGTYLFTKALDLCPAVRFRRAVFAGSVVQHRYDWRRFLPDAPVGPSPGQAKHWQVERIINYVATADWVVAIFPYGLERLRLQDLGGAGHRGFAAGTNLLGKIRPSGTATAEQAADEPIANIGYVVGNHSAALVAQNWDDMSEFILSGATPRATTTVAEQQSTVVWLARIAPLIWFLLTCLVVGIGALLLAPLGTPGWIFAFLFALYLSLLRVVVTKA